jgi:HSP20 family protein
MTESELKVHAKQEVEQSSEPTKPERQFVPAVDIYETADSVTLVAEMPGVPKQNIDIKLEEGVLTLKGEAKPLNLKGRRLLLQEYEAGRYIRRFTISESIDQEKISASMADGVLKVVLPKVKPAQPRKIEVQTG